MAPKMDIDEVDTSAETKTTATKPKKTNATPSASSEESSLHPVMSLAQDIHRLNMIHNNKLSVSDATSIIGCEPTELLDKVMSRVGIGASNSLEEAIKVNEMKYKPAGGEGEESTEEKKEL